MEGIQNPGSRVAHVTLFDASLLTFEPPLPGGSFFVKEACHHNLAGSLALLQWAHEQRRQTCKPTELPTSQYEHVSKRPELGMLLTVAG